MHCSACILVKVIPYPVFYRLKVRIRRPPRHQIGVDELLIRTDNAQQYPSLSDV